MIEIDLKDFNKLLKIGEKFPVTAEKHITYAIRRALTRILGAEKQEAPFGVTGSLRDRWDLQVSPFQGFLRSQMPYAVSVHEGSAPHFVSAEKLAPWAKKKGLNPYAVAKSIAVKGTMPNPFFRRAVSRVQGDVNKEFSEALKNITIEVAKAI